MSNLTLTGNLIHYLLNFMSVFPKIMCFRFVFINYF